MTLLHLPGDPEIAVELRRNSRARRLSLRVSQLDGRVTLTLPPAASRVVALEFLQEKELWVRRQISRRPLEIVPGIGGEIPFEGVDVAVVAGRGRSVRLRDDKMLVPGDASRAVTRIAAFLKVAARERLSAASDHYAGRLGRQVSRITLRDTRSRWGSCTSQGNLMFSWRLIMAPAEVLDYVAAHEVAHLEQMNHSPVYWAVLAKICPGYEKPRRWLRKNGMGLHAYRFVQLTPAARRDHIPQ